MARWWPRCRTGGARAAARRPGRSGRVLAIAQVLVVAAGVAGCPRGEKQPPGPPDRAAQPDSAGAAGALAASPSAAAPDSAAGEKSGADQTELTRATCAKDPCPVQLRARRGSLAPCEATLGWPLPAGPIAPAPAASGGITAGLACPSEPQVWSVGREEHAATVVVCDVSLEHATRGLLVAMEAGFEHVKRRFELFARGTDAWRRVWFEEDPQGPTSWSLVVRPDAAGPGRDQLVLFRVSSGPGKAGKQPDRVVKQAMLWDRSTLVRDPSRAPASGLTAVVAGPFADVAAARRAQAMAPGCLDAAWVMPAAAFPGQAGKVVLAAPAANQKRAEAARSALTACAPGVRTTTATWPAEDN